MNWKRVESDILVIGGSTAGCFAAIEAKKEGMSVVIVDKGCAGKAGASILNPGFFVFFKEDWGVSYDETFDFFVRNGDYISSRKWLEIMLRESYPAVCDLREYGVDLVSTDAECEKSFKERRRHLTPAASRETGMNYMALTGMPYRRMTPKLREQAEKLGATVYSRIMIVRLITNDHHVVGAAGFDLDEGQPYLFLAKAVVMAAGKNSFRPNGMPVYGCTNDPCAMAYRAGAAVAGMEFPDTHNTVAARPLNDGSGNAAPCFDHPYADAAGHPAMITTVSPYTASYFRYANGEGKPLNPLGMDVTLCYEVHQGRGPVTWDIGRATRDDYDAFMKYASDRDEPVIVKIDPDDMKSIPMYGGSASGGYNEQHGGIVVVNTSCASTLPGLFSAGDAAATMCWGAAVRTSFGIMPSAVTGKRAGIGAASYAKDQSLTQPAADELEEAMAEIFTPLGTKTGFSAYWIIQQIQNIMTPYYIQFIKEEARLKAALTMIRFCQKHLSDKIIAGDPHELRLTHETRNMLLGAEMMLVSSLERRESRGMHYREDYPKRDDKNYFAYLRLLKDGDNMRVAKIELSEDWKPDASLPYDRRYMSRHWIAGENMITEG